MEFYITDKADLKPFDLVAIYWYKWRNPKIDTMMLYTYEELLQKVQSSWRYDEAKTVRVMRQQRMLQNAPKPTDSPVIEKKTQPVDDAPVPTTSASPTAGSPASAPASTSLRAEFSIDKLNVNDVATLRKIIADHPGDIKVTVWTIPIQLDQDWLKKLSTLIHWT